MSRRLTEARHLTTLTFEDGCKDPNICTEVRNLMYFSTYFQPKIEISQDIIQLIL